MSTSTSQVLYPNIIEPPAPYWLRTPTHFHPSIQTLSQEKIVDIMICSYPSFQSGTPDNDWHILFFLDNGLGLIELGWQITTAHIPGINSSYVSKARYEDLISVYRPITGDGFEVNNIGPGGVLTYDKLFDIIAKNGLDACTLSDGLSCGQYQVNWRSWVPTLIGILSQNHFVSPSAVAWLATRMKMVWAVDSSGHCSPIRSAEVQLCNYSNQRTKEL